MTTAKFTMAVKGRIIELILEGGDRFDDPGNSKRRIQNVAGVQRAAVQSRSATIWIDSDANVQDLSAVARAVSAAIGCTYGGGP